MCQGIHNFRPKDNGDRNLRPNLSTLIELKVKLSTAHDLRIM